MSFSTHSHYNTRLQILVSLINAKTTKDNPIISAILHFYLFCSIENIGNLSSIIKIYILHYY